MKRIYTLIASLLLAVICMGVRCTKTKPSPYTYNFIDKLNVIPAKQMYQIGDTIRIQSINPPNALIDKNSNQQITVDSSGFTFYIKYHPWDNTPINPPDGFCDYIQGNRVTTDFGLGFTQFVGCNNNGLSINLAIIPKHIGTYTLDLSFNISEVLACSNINPQVPSSVLFRFNVNGNKDIFLTIPYEKRRVYGGAFEEYVDSHVVFAFKVE